MDPVKHKLKGSALNKPRSVSFSQDEFELQIESTVNSQASTLSEPDERLNRNTPHKQLRLTDFYLKKKQKRIKHKSHKKKQKSRIEDDLCKDMKKMAINDINNEIVCDYIQKSFITSSYIVGLGSIDG